uniref:Uncharacterized protein n=1 Tax=Arundo donax TaxID=35708 RepID=A0A0A9FYE8_ARUDO
MQVFVNGQSYGTF